MYPQGFIYFALCKCVTVFPKFTLCRGSLPLKYCGHCRKVLAIKLHHKYSILFSDKVTNTGGFIPNSHMLKYYA